MRHSYQSVIKYISSTYQDLSDVMILVTFAQKVFQFWGLIIFFCMTDQFFVVVRYIKGVVMVLTFTYAHKDNVNFDFEDYESKSAFKKLVNVTSTVTKVAKKLKMKDF